MVLLLLETIIVIMNNIRWWCGWSLRCFLVVVRGLHRPFILIHHHKTKILLNRSLPSLFLLSLSLSLTSRRRRRKKERERYKSDDEVFILRMIWFFPRTLYHHQEKRFAPHATLDDDAKQHDNEEETTRNKKKDADDEVRTRAPVGYSVTVMYHCYSQCSYVGYLNAEIEIEVWTVGF